MKMNDKIFKELTELEPYFYSVIKDNYLRVLSSDKLAMTQRLYKEITNDSMYDKIACSNCTFNLFTKLARLYYKELKSREDIQNISNETVYTILPEVKVKPIKKKKNASN